MITQQSLLDLLSKYNIRTFYIKVYNGKGVVEIYILGKYNIDGLLEEIEVNKPAILRVDIIKKWKGFFMVRKRNRIIEISQ